MVRRPSCSNASGRMVGGRWPCAACSTLLALAWRARWARLMIWGGARSMRPSRYCSSAVRGATHTLSVVSSLSCRAVWPAGARATKNRVSNRRELTVGDRGVIQRDHGASWRVCRRSCRAVSMSAKGMPSRSMARARRASRARPGAVGSASSRPHSSRASRSAATCRPEAVAASVPGSARRVCSVAVGWSSKPPLPKVQSASSSLPPGNT